jgi:hypothetical protein
MFADGINCEKKIMPPGCGSQSDQAQTAACSLAQLGETSVCLAAFECLHCHGSERICGTCAISGFGADSDTALINRRVTGCLFWD